MVTALAFAFPDLSPPAQPGLHIELLGPPRVAWEGRPLALTRRQSRALLYRLAASRQPAPRDQLCFLFWPDLPETEARCNLAVLPHHLRRAMPLATALISDGDAIALDPSGVRFDVLTAAEAFATGAEGWQEHPCRHERRAQSHEIVPARLTNGATFAEVEAFVQGRGAPPSLDAVGGTVGLDRNQRVWITMDLPAGEYIALCFITDEAGETPRIFLGMFKLLTVR
jgi:hypothetical protein